ncbi:hypothetical protein IW140_004987 [Coemansia sp. RSA 1813]|nr:hypothetical protein EV178_005586 [Coemansia sp. RSA 1646]KAJ1768561.1 hypothetical protein LPJ74_004799 [Coemansia sp. RSA 1843]KAJ2085484.1 hypothetical protein IW138_006306 [Coemansia sp. RSA 986]KAJ2212998.1 hypothetical protein EV179_004226 [Coemansia sp. RSA 487]KAJ2566299.1 hypothetical protein IW140_004987 [Coemansia sp. RSA 1813]
MIFTYIGIGVVAYYISVVLTILYDVFLKSGVSLKKFGAGQGAWAVVTGCTDGMGRETALELARKGFNVMLISRTQEKLEAMAKEVRQLNVEAKVLAVDYANVSAEKWTQIAQELDALRVGVLVNNVGISYDHPMYVEEVQEEVVNSLIELNMRAMVNMTRIVLPQMKERKNGLIVNNGSFAALVASPYLSIYSGTKGFVQYFSQSLASEVASHGILVEHLQTYFVCSRMSKMRRPTFLVPMPKPYIQCAFRKIGVQGGSSEPFTSIPFFPHALLAFATQKMVPKQFAINQNGSLLSSMRKRALKKKEREAQKQQ